MSNLLDLRERIINFLETSKRLAETFLSRFAEQDGGYLQPLIEAITQSIHKIQQCNEDDLYCLTECAQEIVKIEEHLRKDNHIGARYSVIASQVKNTITAIEALQAVETTSTEEAANSELNPDQQYIYLHLFNTLGGKLVSWQQMLNPKSMIDHSVNRPIYNEAAHVEELIRAKSDNDLHAYLKIIVDREAILMSAQQSVLKDNLGHPLLRLKHGAIKMENIVSFHHKGKIYQLQNSKLVLIANEENSN